MEITAEIHKICLGFPKNEMYGLVSQMNRASVSIPSNIAEGSNRGNTHFIHFFNYKPWIFFRIADATFNCQHEQLH